MCGIFGVLTSAASPVRSRETRAVLDALFRLSESRGREAAGLAALTTDELIVFKEPFTASAVLRTPGYDALHRRIHAAIEGRGGTAAALAMVGHSRLVTNGLEIVHENNQPVVAGGFVGVHNGIVVNEAELWARHAGLRRAAEVDTEIIFELLRKHFVGSGDIGTALGLTYQEIYGETTIAALARDLDCAILATNTGSLYVAHSAGNGLMVFASERYILTRLIQGRIGARILSDALIGQVSAGAGWIVDVRTLEHREVKLASARLNGRLPVGSRRPDREIVDVSPRNTVPTGSFPNIGEKARVPQDLLSDLDQRRSQIATLRRCSRCVLPETMPFIEFDAEGVCNFCRNYDPIRLRGRDALEAVLAPMRSRGSGPEILVTFSGGRDSSYGLHYLVREMGMKPIAYTYDWGMVTDLARRNQARLCGTLGVEHIWVSADIRRKRANIRKNVTAWLRQPNLGMIPLFMAGDKQFFYYANKVKEQTGLGSVVLCENLLEKTSFKSGFCGVAPSHRTKSVYSLSLANKARMLAYYAARYLTNVGYLNGSLLDTMGAYASYYVIDHDFLSLFQYIDWDESTIESVLLGEYAWETAPDTRSTWRIGDGTAPFYNYIYYLVAGFSENDTFRSNQVREGKLDRATALARAVEDNAPRYDSLKWYCDIIGIDYVAALRRIHEIRPLYHGRD